jgi:hypothetical protein
MDPVADRTRPRADLAWLGGLAAILLAVMLWPYLRHGYRFGVGPDMPVYLWWTRVGAAEGLSLVGERPGTPALLAVLTGVLHLPVVAVAAGLQAALGTAVGAAGAVVVRGRTRDVPGRFAWVAAGGLAGLFAVHLGAGYLANLAFVVTFLAAGAALASPARTSVPAVAAAILLAGGGLAHPRFFLVGAAILLGVVVWSRSAEGRDDPAARRTVLAVAASGAGVVAGLAAMLVGPPRLDVDTSKDGFLRRAGLTGSLRSAYLDRFVHRWTRYVQVVSLPLAFPGASRTVGFTARFLIGWGLAMLIGVPIGLATGWYPADRLITFAFPVPILAGVGLAWVWRRLEARRILAIAVVAALGAAMAGGALIAWGRQAPFLTPLEVEAVTAAGRIADTVPPGTPLVFVVDDADATATFLATRAGNVIRAAVPPDRVPDVYVFVGTPRDLLAGRPTARGDREYDELSRRSLAAIPSDGPDPLVLVVAPFDRTGEARGAPGLDAWTPDVSATIAGSLDEAPAARDPLVPASPTGIGLGAIVVLALLWTAGSGWSRWAFADGPTAVALAPAFGLATLILVGVALERVGLALSGSLGPTLVAVLAGGGGYLVRAIGQRRPRS